ncbi:MAG: hypothetical protein E5V34_14010, partial [Mesorhizobium sp.]
MANTFREAFEHRDQVAFLIKNLDVNHASVKRIPRAQLQHEIVIAAKLELAASLARTRIHNSHLHPEVIIANALGTVAACGGVR